MNTNSQSSVILLHGLARTQHSMASLSKALQAQGYHVANVHYPSTRAPIEELAVHAINKGLALCEKSERVSFVTHSMGGILVRYYLKHFPLEQLHRVVMLAPPNQGSEVVDKLADLPGFKWWNGPAGLQLGTDPTSVPNQLGPAHFDLGVIAGTFSVNLLLSSFLPSPDDGKVSVASTKLGGMKDHIELPVSHTFMMRDKTVIQQVLHFLREGQFAHLGTA